MKRSEFLGLFGPAAIFLFSRWQGKDKEKEKGGTKKEEKCEAEFVDGTHQAEPTCTPKKMVLDRRCKGTIYKFIYPGSKYDDKEGRKRADDELKRVTDFYAKYCIDLTIEEIKLPEKKAKDFKDVYKASTMSLDT